MTSLLVIIVLVLLAVAIWQLTKIFDLTQVGNSSTNDSQIANDNDNNVQGYLMFGFLAFIYIFTIYGFIKWGKKKPTEWEETMRKLIDAIWAFFGLSAGEQKVSEYKSGHDTWRPF